MPRSLAGGPGRARRRRARPGPPASFALDARRLTPPARCVKNEYSPPDEGTDSRSHQETLHVTCRLLFQRVRFLILAGVLVLAAVVAGCDSAGYPDHLRYPERTDLLVKGAKAIDIRKPLPPPGDLDEAIVEAANVGKGKEPPFESVSPKEVSAETRKELQQTLREIFGTPSYPTIEPTARKNAGDEARAEVEENKKLYDKAVADGVATF